MKKKNKIFIIIIAIILVLIAFLVAAKSLTGNNNETKNELPNLNLPEDNNENIQDENTQEDIQDENIQDENTEDKDMIDNIPNEEFNIVNNLEHKNKERIEELANMMLNIINGPKYNDGTSYCQEVDYKNSIEKNEYTYYYKSLNFSSIKSLKEYWSKYFTKDYLNNINSYFIEENNNLYCFSSHKDGMYTYDKEKTKYKVYKETENEIIVIGKVWTKNAGKIAGKEGNYNIVMYLTKEKDGTLLINKYSGEILLEYDINN